MIRPTKHNDHANLLNEAMIAESKWLNRNAPTFGNVAPEDYANRAQAFNTKCKEIGATTFLVVEA